MHKVGFKIGIHLRSWVEFPAPPTQMVWKAQEGGVCYYNLSCPCLCNKNYMSCDYLNYSVFFCMPACFPTCDQSTALLCIICSNSLPVLKDIMLNIHQALNGVVLCLGSLVMPHFTSTNLLGHELKLLALYSTLKTAIVSC